MPVEIHDGKVVASTSEPAGSGPSEIERADRCVLFVAVLLAVVEAGYVWCAPRFYSYSPSAAECGALALPWAPILLYCMFRAIYGVVLRVRGGSREAVVNREETTLAGASGRVSGGEPVTWDPGLWVLMTAVLVAMAEQRYVALTYLERRGAASTGEYAALAAPWAPILLYCLYRAIRWLQRQCDMPAQMPGNEAAPDTPDPAAITAATRYRPVSVAERLIPRGFFFLLLILWPAAALAWFLYRWYRHLPLEPFERVWAAQVAVLYGLLWYPMYREIRRLRRKHRDG